MSIETRRKFGATFSPKMGVRKCTKIWFDDEQVKPEIRLLYPDLDATMDDCRLKISIFDAKQAIKDAKKKIEDTTIEAVNAAAAIVAGIVSLPADIAAALAAQIDLDISIDLESKCKKEIHEAIDVIIPTYLE